MIVTTTDSIEGRRIKEYRGIVASEAVIGVTSSLHLNAGLPASSWDNSHSTGVTSPQSRGRSPIGDTYNLKQNLKNIKFLSSSLLKERLSRDFSVNVFRDLFARVRDFVGGRTRSYEKELSKYRQELIEELIKKASEKEANAIVGLNFSYEMYESMLMISAWGTAVIIE